MACSRKTLAAVVSACAFASVLAAESAPNPVLINPTPVQKAQPDTSGRTRAISPEVAAQLQAAAPKYTPPLVKPEPKPEEEQVDARDVDKPRNGIIRLNRIYVRPTTPYVNPEAVFTEKGAKDIAVRKYISEVDRAMNRFTLPLFGQSTEKRAMDMYAEDQRLKNISDMTDAARTASKSDAAQGAYILRETQKTFMRTNDFGWNGGGPK